MCSYPKLVFKTFCVGTQYVNTCFSLWMHGVVDVVGVVLAVSVSSHGGIRVQHTPPGGVNLAGNGRGLPPIFIFLIFLFSPKFHLWPQPFFSLSLSSPTPPPFFNLLPYLCPSFLPITPFCYHCCFYKTKSVFF